MTKSTITRERLEQLADNNTICKVSWDERIELAQIALAAMDSSESVELPLDYLQGHKDGLEWAAQLAEANHPETGDWLYDDPIELAKAIRKGPDMPPAQPVADSEPDRNPVLAYADSYRDMAKQGIESVPIWSVITDLERNIAPLYRHTQPVPVVNYVPLGDSPYDVPYSMPSNLREFIDQEIGILFSDDDAKGVWIACRRAAMLQAAPVCTCPSGDGSLRWPCPVHPGNSPAIPDSARDALEKALAAMEFMGDTLNNLDAVCTEDVELVAPAFDAVRSVLAAAPQEVKGE
ncbi:DUF551 domain-containing protein [Klebsiella pneumoniae]|nr:MULTISPECIES: DUF551 domain-containing protein [Klebsiella]MDX7579989.1 DUF551 domain-containing protein [Klebsiella pneumoniae]MDZ0238902.1 DUF551 domain-containing protein [Klebsiella pneumoniae]MDZ0250622.1 DUF551 domain-containing protein [Klebsiella pneumoniae]MDZ0260126.1 DUF551 domain-containing protein [Klebsiella pneumoniae]SAU77307.1 Uncharacterised protein [Klebsiella quasipneumoniae]